MEDLHNPRVIFAKILSQSSFIDTLYFEQVVGNARGFVILDDVIGHLLIDGFLGVSVEF